MAFPLGTSESHGVPPGLEALFFFFFFFPFLATLQHLELLDQGSDLSHSSDLHCSCGHARSLTHCAGWGMEPASQGSRDAAFLLCHSGNPWVCSVHVEMGLRKFSF